MADNGLMTDATDVPEVTLARDVAMPMMGFGTWPLRGHKACCLLYTSDAADE